MSKNPSEEEPSIEEILASIRQIISDDDDDQESDDSKKVIEDPIRHKSNDVLELTEQDLADQEEDDEPEEMEIDMIDHEDEPEEEPEPVVERPREKPRRTVPSEILSSGTQSAALGSIAKLASKMPINSTRSYNGVTLEDIVREMLHPMLREWMDDNLPPMVERIVQKEMEKLARRAADDF